MDDRDRERLRGLLRLVHEGVDTGATLVERHHRRAIERPLELLERVAPPVQVVRQVSDVALTVSYGSVRVVNAALAAVDDWVLVRATLGRGFAPYGSRTAREH